MKKMNRTNLRPRRFGSRALATLFIGIAALSFSPRVAEAQHRAKLSKALAEQLTAGSTSLNVVFQGPQAEVDRVAKTYGVLVTKRLDMGAVLTGSGAQFDALAADDNVTSLTEDGQVTSTMAITTQSTGANQLWAAQDGSSKFGGLTGAGIGVVVIDSGIGQHPDIERRVRARRDFLADTSGPADAYGHGTHVAGIIAGSGGGSRSADGTAYVGMAPGAELVSLRVLDGTGNGYVSDVILALEWAIKNKARYKLRVVNVSLGHAATETYATDPMALAVERAVSAGLVVVASAGNLGKSADGTPLVGAVVSPGFTPGALTVGALNTRGTVARSDDAVASYSSRGPVGDPDDSSTWEVKPDLVAPGNAIIATGLPGTYLYDTLTDRHVTGAAGGTYLTLSGSSMATAVVSGAVAQLLQSTPDLTPAQVKFLLQVTAQHVEGAGLIEQGAGSLNVPLAVATAQAGSLDAAPSAVKIGGEMITAGGMAFLSKKTAGQFDASSVSVLGNTIVWGGRGVSGDTIVWGGRGVSGDTIVWGGRGVSGDTIVWGGRGVSGDTIVWGGRGVSGDTIVWGGRGVSGDTIVWGGRGVSGDTIVWGGRGVSGDTIVWGGRGVSGDTIVWGGRTEFPNTSVSGFSFEGGSGTAGSSAVFTAPSKK